MAFTTYGPGVVDHIKALRSLQDKFFFETLVRGMYVTKNETFNNANISGLIGTMQQFSHSGSQTFKLARYTDLSDNHKDWLKIFKFKFLEKKARKDRDKDEKDFLATYKRRSGFYPPGKDNLKSTTPLIFSTEELATMFHLPGTVVTTPTLNRVDARKGDPPTNLPI
jgi:hypothetical protein